MSAAEDPVWKNLADAAVEALHDQIGRPLSVIVHAGDDDADEFIHSCHINISLADVVAAAAHLLDDALSLIDEASGEEREMTARIIGALAALGFEADTQDAAAAGAVLQ